MDERPLQRGRQDLHTSPLYSRLVAAIAEDCPWEVLLAYREVRQMQPDLAGLVEFLNRQPLEVTLLARSFDRLADFLDRQKDHGPAGCCSRAAARVWQEIGCFTAAAHSLGDAAKTYLQQDPVPLDLAKASLTEALRYHPVMPDWLHARGAVHYRLALSSRASGGDAAPFLGLAEQDFMAALQLRETSEIYRDLARVLDLGGRDQEARLARQREKNTPCLIMENLRVEWEDRPIARLVIPPGTSLLHALQPANHPSERLRPASLPPPFPRAGTTG